MQRFLALGLIALSLSLAGCQAVDDKDTVLVPTEESPPTSTESSTTTESPERPVSEFSIPDDFPTEIPVRAGEIVVGTATGEENSRTWVVEVLINDLELAREEELANLANAGFYLEEESGIGTDTYMGRLVGERFTINLKIYLEPETGEREILYFVTTNS